jgi:hypothetical protein
MPALVAGIHVFNPASSKDLDGRACARRRVARRRVKPGHDALGQLLH